jgi:nitrous oxidase accessory protein NosD
VSLWFSHGWEIRDSYLHDGYGYGSGQNYGVHIMIWNSDHKVENNTIYSVRHGVNFEGGGSGSAILYNYFDSHYESEDSGSTRTTVRTR